MFYSFSINHFQLSLIVDGIEEAVSELFAGLGLIYQKMEKEREKNETCLRLNKIDKRRKIHERPSQRPGNGVQLTLFDHVRFCPVEVNPGIKGHQSERT